MALPKKYQTEGVKSSPEVAKKIASLPPAYLDCRDPGLRHAWMRLNDFHVIEQYAEEGTKVIAIGREEVCGRCDTVKHERFLSTRSGGLQKIGQSYSYPEGYLMPGVPRGVTPSTVVHQEQYRRAMEHVARAARGDRETSER
jgi:hypothetical protein